MREQGREGSIEKDEEVFLDESYIHQHYNRNNDDSIWDLNNEQNVQRSKAPQNGKLYCFLCAIPGLAPEFDHDADEKDVLEEMPKPSNEIDMSAGPFGRFVHRTTRRYTKGIIIMSSM